MVRILLVEYQALVRNAMKYLLETNFEYRVVAEASNLKDALLALRKNRIDLLVTGIDLEDSCGIELTRQSSALFPKLKIIVISTHTSYVKIKEAINSGANGYFLKECTEKELFDGIPEIMNDQPYFCKKTNRILKMHSEEESESILEENNLPTPQKNKIHLTKRETEILKLINAGYINKEIAAQLF